MYGERGEVHTEFWWGDLWERGDMEDLGLDSGDHDSRGFEQPQEEILMFIFWNLLLNCT